MEARQMKMERHDAGEGKCWTQRGEVPNGTRVLVKSVWVRSGVDVSRLWEEVTVPGGGVEGGVVAAEQSNA